MKYVTRMAVILMLPLIPLLMGSTLQASQMLTIKPSTYSVSETIDRLEAVLKKKGITIFARVDHKAGAIKAGINMKADAQLLIFGNPNLGTPLMNENILIGLDLPMKALSWKDEKGKVWLAYVNPSELKRRHQMTKNEIFFNKMKKALNALTNKALAH
ncbi:hypothetical protein MNBD_GAMMA11-2548 [hydrothermal vent metagenome]|uniref:DUF302 domain-containing protein n=1 Tax=hydrothermal vent metagenome TaxID=652676 RepID=A0A3B0X166_9ZZZZ